MEKQTFSIPNISCAHCIRAINDELSELEGVVSVEGNPDSKEITVAWEAPVSLQKIIETLKDINYPAA